MTALLKRRFRLTERRTSVRAEVVGGLATFLTMSYILFVNPAILSGLVMAGYLMIRIVADIDWTRPATSIPAFLTIAGIPLTFSIAAGIGLGVLSCLLAMVATGKARDVHPLMWAIARFLVAFFAADWLSANVF